MRRLQVNAPSEDTNIRPALFGGKLAHDRTCQNGVIE